jgi:hypothetical protein
MLPDVCNLLADESAGNRWCCDLKREEAVG